MLAYDHFMIVPQPPRISKGYAIAQPFLFWPNAPAPHRYRAPSPLSSAMDEENV